MKAENRMKLYPTLWPEDAVYYEKVDKQDLNRQVETGEIWLMCINPECDNRAFRITPAEFTEADNYIECEYCGNECAPASKPEWAKA